MKKVRHFWRGILPDKEECVSKRALFICLSFGLFDDQVAEDDGVLVRVAA
jgi:hypothetical protein